MVGSFGVVIDINKHKVYKTKDMFTVLICEYSQTNKTESFSWKFYPRIIDDMALYELINNKKMHFTNVGLDKNGEVTGTSGSLSRFCCKPLTIISEISNGKSIKGYRLAKPNGEVTSMTVKKLIEYCEKSSKSNRIPIQNAIFVKKNENRSSFIRCYLDTGFIQEVIVTENKVSTIKEEKTVYSDNNVSELNINKIKTEDKHSKKLTTDTKSSGYITVEDIVLGKAKHDITKLTNEEIKELANSILKKAEEESKMYYNYYHSDKAISENAIKNVANIFNWIVEIGNKYSMDLALLIFKKIGNKSHISLINIILNDNFDKYCPDFMKFSQYCVEANIVEVKD